MSSCGLRLIVKAGKNLFIKSFYFLSSFKGDKTLIKILGNPYKSNDKCMRIWSVCVKNRSESDCIRIFFHAYASGCTYI